MKKKRVIYIILIISVGVAASLWYCQTSTLFRVLTAEDARTVDEQIALLEPHLVTYLPENVHGPLPVVLVVPGCLHTKSHNPAWHDLFLDAGYAVVILDSFAPRGIEGDELERVCSLRAARGFDRAGDIVAVVSHLRQQSWVDIDRLVLAGWSHGAWAVMDAMAFHAEGKSPYNLKDASNKLTGIHAILLVYPHCGFGTAAYTGFEWTSNIPVLMLLGDNDRGINWKQCVTWHEQQNNEELQLVILPGAEHTFDIPEPYNRNPARFSEEHLQTAMSIVRDLLNR